jgi:hypothetical protein
MSDENPAALVGNTDVALAYLKRLYSTYVGFLQLRALEPVDGTKQSETFTVHTAKIDDARPFVDKWMGTRNLYHSANLMSADLGAKAGDTEAYDIIVAKCSDTDFKPAAAKDPAWFRAAADASGLVLADYPCDAVVATGGGVQTLTMLPQPVPEAHREILHAAMEFERRQIQHVLRAHEAVSDSVLPATQLLRLPGTINVVAPDKAARGRSNEVVRVLRSREPPAPDRTPELFAGWLAQAFPGATPEQYLAHLKDEGTGERLRLPLLAIKFEGYPAQRPHKNLLKHVNDYFGVRYFDGHGVSFAMAAGASVNVATVRNALMSGLDFVVQQDTARVPFCGMLGRNGDTIYLAGHNKASSGQGVELLLFLLAHTPVLGLLPAAAVSKSGAEDAPAISLGMQESAHRLEKLIAGELQGEVGSRHNQYKKVIAQLVFRGLGEEQLRSFTMRYMVDGSMPEAEVRGLVDWALRKLTPEVPAAMGMFTQLIVFFSPYKRIDHDEFALVCEGKLLHVPNYRALMDPLGVEEVFAKELGRILPERKRDAHRAIITALMAEAIRLPLVESLGLHLHRALARYATEYGTSRMQDIDTTVLETLKTGVACRQANAAGEVVAVWLIFEDLMQRVMGHWRIAGATNQLMAALLSELGATKHAPPGTVGTSKRRAYWRIPAASVEELRDAVIKAVDLEQPVDPNAPVWDADAPADF